jgi:hypothetical protein
MVGGGNEDDRGANLEAYAPPLTRWSNFPLSVAGEG